MGTSDADRAFDRPELRGYDVTYARMHQWGFIVLLADRSKTQHAGAS